MSVSDSMPGGGGDRADDSTERAVTDEPRPGVQLSRTDLDRVIRRATELQLQEGLDDGGSLTEDEVLRIGGEVGLTPDHMRRALGEVRAAALVPALPPDNGPLRRLVGQAHVRAERVVPGVAVDVEERLARWLGNQESLHPVRRRAGFSLWEPAEGLVAQLQRSLKWGGQRYELAAARQVELSVQSLEDGFSLVTLTVDVRNVRSEHGGVAIGVSAAVCGVVALAATVTLLPPVGVVAAALGGMGAGGAGGVAIGRSTFHQKAERIRLASEGLLDRLERGELVRPGKRRM
jgi:hypothetical protein